MTDYGADPLWDLAGDDMIDLDRLPVSDDLRAAVRDWARAHDRLAYRAMDVEDGVAGAVAPSEAQWADSKREGRRLWLAVREELAGRFEVGYVTFDERGRCVQWEPDGQVVACPPGRPPPP
jgi:hypothetical protein